MSIRKVKQKNHYFNMQKVKTKYDIRDKVWLIYENKATERVITQVEIIVNTQKSKVTYQLNHKTTDYDEYKLYTSKEELLKSL